MTEPLAWREGYNDAYYGEPSPIYFTSPGEKRQYHDGYHVGTARRMAEESQYRRSGWGVVAIYALALALAVAAYLYL